nr:unnamed protein product [Spirometra erinaceieuropaei]
MIAMEIENLCDARCLHANRRLYFIVGTSPGDHITEALLIFVFFLLRELHCADFYFSNIEVCDKGDLLNEVVDRKARRKDVRRNRKLEKKPGPSNSSWKPFRKRILRKQCLSINADHGFLPDLRLKV